MNINKSISKFLLIFCISIGMVGFCNNKVSAASSSDESFTYNGSQGWWKSNGYYSSKITGKVVSGDFNGDGKQDVAAFYDNGMVNGKPSTSLHTWISTGTSFGYKGSQGWWKSEGYDCNRIADKVISGDFNGDGKDDIAAFYKVDDNTTNLHVWISTGSSFQYQYSQGWWNSKGYNSDKISSRIVAGDFNGDGKDDIAAFYKVGDCNTNLHTWISTGSSFQYQYSQGWWNSNGYNSDQISNKVVAGDFNGDGKDDIAAFYKADAYDTRLHTWMSTGSSFQYKDSQGWWNSKGYNSDQISNRVVAGDFNGDGKDDVAAFYKADAYDTRLNTWISTGSSFQYKDSKGWWNSTGYNPDQISNRVVAGDFNGDGSYDVAAFYANGQASTSLHVWQSNASNITRRIVEYSKQFIGVPYVWGGTSPSGFDCSGLVQYVYAHFGYNLYRISEEQINNGIEVSKGELKPGDLVFFGNYGAPGHVGMYVGNGQFIEAPSTGKTVRISNLADRSDFCRARRIIQ
ncbi:hypothetical protein A0J52_07310 [Clostridium sporogenes]|uniref:NlpC/P60 family protein n=1 Tax=Clostridium TaxID=1485 RepID=UPI00077FFC0E|nr:MULTISPECIES: NlpC/P60 family protein [Clostridium]KYN79074.1 hypothetical protein A0J52_07310 [Clostridium sporogenes]